MWVFFLLRYKPNMKKILGFDVSSTVTAYCCLELDGGKIINIKHGYIKPQKTGSIFERLEKFSKDISAIISSINPDEVAIEDIIQFMGRNSSANTIITLALFNRTVGLASHKLNLTPTMYAVSSIRSKIKVGSKLPKKEEIPEILESKFNIKFPYVYAKPKAGSNLAVGKIKQESYDLGDAFAVAICHAIKKNELK